MSEEKESSKLTLEQIEMLVVFSHASEDYPDLSFEEVALKLLGPEPFKPTPNGKQFEKQCREVFASNSPRDGSPDKRPDWGPEGGDWPERRSAQLRLC
jgi:hypothetical protein